MMEREIIAERLPMELVGQPIAATLESCPSAEVVWQILDQAIAETEGQLAELRRLRRAWTLDGPGEEY